jgi:hypothetical protein
VPLPRRCGLAGSPGDVSESSAVADGYSWAGRGDGSGNSW